jgi:hypothetical protein
MEAAWKSVVGVTESGLPASFTPTLRAQAIRPPSITAMLTPGTLCCVIRSGLVAVIAHLSSYVETLRAEPKEPLA